MDQIFDHYRQALDLVSKDMEYRRARGHLDMGFQFHKVHPAEMLRAGTAGLASGFSRLKTQFTHPPPPLGRNVPKLPAVGVL